MESFDSTKKSLYDILNDIKNGKIQLPDFQRGWVWDDFRIRGLLASVAKSFPIGAIMLLETGNENIKFKTKPIEGVVGVENVKPEYLILDGQQRLTSLYQSIISNEVVRTRNEKGEEIKRWYYIDMKKALDNNSDLEDAIFSINENKIITEDIGRKVVLDLSTEENEFKNLMYPVCKVDEYDEWRTKFIEYWNYEKEKIVFWNEFEKKIIGSFNKYQLPIIVLKKENPKEAVCQIFEKVNTGGVSLTVFELLTATFAAEDFDLKSDWEEIRKELIKYKNLEKLTSTDFIQAITLYSTLNKKDLGVAVSAKRKDMLNLYLDDYKKYRNEIKDGFIKAAKILVENHIYTYKDLPYSTQLIPMAVILAKLGKNIDNAGSKAKFNSWYWCGVFGELYGSAVESRFARDVVQVVDWILGSVSIPDTIYDANFLSDRLFTLRTRNSAAYKGIYALLLKDAIDWLSASKIDISTFFSEAIDIHHIFPVSWCEKNNIPREYYDSIINKTPLSSRTNKIIKGDPPSKYLERLKKQAGLNDNDFIDLIQSHKVNINYLMNDDFMGFFQDRQKRLLELIKNAMGKDKFV